ncbi:MAG TPA: hypothetical protein P5215_07260, partial [Bacteroidales bacterium]|nr:hypothetical protein [Bacteroidales bacterium]
LPPLRAFHLSASRSQVARGELFRRGVGSGSCYLKDVEVSKRELDFFKIFCLSLTIELKQSSFYEIQIIRYFFYNVATEHYIPHFSVRG